MATIEEFTAIALAYNALVAQHPSQQFRENMTTCFNALCGYYYVPGYDATGRNTIYSFYIGFHLLKPLDPTDPLTGQLRYLLRMIWLSIPESMCIIPELSLESRTNMLATWESRYTA